MKMTKDYKVGPDLKGIWTKLCRHNIISIQHILDEWIKRKLAAYMEVFLIHSKVSHQARGNLVLHSQHMEKELVQDHIRLSKFDDIILGHI